jgi:hypothetical protein
MPILILGVGIAEPSTACSAVLSRWKIARLVVRRHTLTQAFLARATPRCAKAPVQQFQTMPAVVENLLKLGGGSTALSGRKMCLSANIHMIEAGNIGDERNLPQLDRGSHRVAFP